LFDRVFQTYGDSAFGHHALARPQIDFDRVPEDFSSPPEAATPVLDRKLGLLPKDRYGA
jgi:hypothetical protein